MVNHMANNIGDIYKYRNGGGDDVVDDILSFAIIIDEDDNDEDEDPLRIFNSTFQRSRKI